MGQGTSSSNLVIVLDRLRWPLDRAGLQELSAEGFCSMVFSIIADALTIFETYVLALGNVVNQQAELAALGKKTLK
ncbi:hypothetical protein ACJ73_06735 [Blastomyces percursus]|uniref:Uncharacterized protein n=1 Tax=Blastomyces percursus TaxID=1658174 RepID=A0A1J9Q1E3_9EURO|nr:hypothetical protein ACJ73_06735 [Blastomyces percursus]